MKLYIGITDYNWFKYLSNQDGIDEVNFWQPSGNRQFRALQKGELFLFKLHAPENYIVGYGLFAHSTILPISQAWDYFGAKNGTVDLIEMRSRVEMYRRIPSSKFEDYKIGCILLEEPVFLPKEKWFKIPDWKRGIQQGMTYELESETGKYILNNLQLPNIRVAEPRARFGDPVQITPRLGQGTFRSMILDIYDRKCAVTQEKILPVTFPPKTVPLAS